MRYYGFSVLLAAFACSVWADSPVKETSPRMGAATFMPGTLEEWLGQPLADAIVSVSGSSETCGPCLSPAVVGAGLDAVTRCLGDSVEDWQDGMPFAVWPIENQTRCRQRVTFTFPDGTVAVLTFDGQGQGFFASVGERQKECSFRYWDPCMLLPGSPFNCGRRGC